MGRGGLAGGAGPCQHNGLGSPLADHVRHLRKPLFVQSLVHPDQLPDSAGACQLVQIRHGFALHQRAPPLPLGKHREEIGHIRYLCAEIRVLVVGIDQNKAVFRRHNVPHRQIAGGGQHFPVEIIGVALVYIFVKIVGAAPAKKPGLVLLPLCPEPLHGLMQRHPPTNQRNVLIHQLLKGFLQLLGGKILGPGNLDIHAGAQSAADLSLGPRTALLQSQEDGKESGSQIAFLSGLVGVAQQMYLSFRCRHGLPHGWPLSLGILLPQRDVVEGEDLTGDFRRQRPLR